MIVFDVDGTLVGGEAEDWASFNAAFLHAAGFALDEDFYKSIEEITARAIVHEALAGWPLEEKRRIERAVCAEHLRRMQQAHAAQPTLHPTDGALALLRELRERNVPIAIATGGWRETIVFRLNAAGIPFAGLPLVTSSDHYSRAEIIAAAVKAAGQPLEEALYVGDGLWDFRAAKKLGIPFIGVGPRRELLQKAGASFLLPDLSPPGFWRMLESIKPPGF